MAPQHHLRLLFIATLFVASGGLQWCAPTRSPVTRSRLGATVGASISNTDTMSYEGSVQIFLRFSPLIGGPPLPLHVEVILAEDDADTESKGIIYVRKTNNLESTAFLNSYPTLHRLDFLPQNPTDPSTVVRLASLQSVPGRLRYRYYAQNITASSDRTQDGRGVTVLLPVGSISYKTDDKEDRWAISTALEFTNERTDDIYNELRILLGKNCLSFAIDLLSELNKVHRIRRVKSWNEIDFGD